MNVNFSHAVELPFTFFQSYIERGLFCFTYGQDDAIVDFVHVDNVVLSHVLAGIALKADQPVAVSMALFVYLEGLFFRPFLDYKY